MLRAAPAIAIVVLTGPILFGLLATLLPAFGWFPALGGTSLSLEPWNMLLAQPGILRSALLSYATGLLTAFIALALVAGFLAGWLHSRAFGAFTHLLSPLLAVPHAAAAFGLAFLLVPSGWLMRLVSPELTGFTRPPDWLIIHDPLGLTMMAGLIAKELPFLFLVSLAALPQTRAQEFTRVASGLGYGRMAAFLHGVWPQLYPQIRLAVFAVIAYSSSVIDVALILGPTNPAPLAARLVTWMNDPDLTMRFQASAGAVMQLLVTGAALLTWVAGEKLVTAGARNIRESGRRCAEDGLPRGGFAFAVALAAIAVFAGLGLLGLWSFSGYWGFPDALPRALSLQIWEGQLTGLGRPLGITFVVGLAATLAAIILALACLEREARTHRSGGSRALLLLYLPLIVPQASFVFGLQLFFLFAGIGTSFWALALVHLVFVLPYVFLSMSDAWRAWDKRYAQSGQSLGRGLNAIFWRVRLPMLLRPVLAASALGFAVSVSQYLPTLLIGAGRWPTITTEAVALASGGDRRLIGVYAFLQMALPFAGFAAALAVPALVFMRRAGMRASI